METRLREEGELNRFLRKFKRVPAGRVAVGIGARGLSVIRLRVGAEPGPRLEMVDFHQLASEAEVPGRLQSIVQKHQLKGADCYTYLEPGEYKLIQIESPQVPAEEQESALRWRVKDLLEYPLDQAVIDSFVIPTDNQPGRPEQRYVVAARRELIAERVALIKQAGLNLQAIDISELALRNLAALTPENSTGVAFLQLEEERGAISLYQNGNLYLTRYIDVGSAHLLAAGEQGDEMFRYESVMLEVQRSLDYYESHFSQRPIRSLVVAPMHDELPGFLEHLIGSLGISVRQLDLSALVQGPQPFPDRLQAQCLGALGAAIREAGVDAAG